MLIITSDNLQDLYKKGELIPNYYNPQKIFTNIIFTDLFFSSIKINNLKKACGNAKVEILRVKFPVWRQRLALALPFFIPKKIIKNLASFITEQKVHIIRCYGHRTNLLLGVALKKATGVPLLASIHINPDLDILHKEKNLIKKIILSFFSKTENFSLQHCDYVFAVYSSIVPFLKKLKIKNYSVIYNAVQVRKS